MMNKEQKSKYISSNGRRCPFCDGFVMATTSPVISEAGYATVKFHSQCGECAEHWTDVYKLAEVEE